MAKVSRLVFLGFVFGLSVVFSQAPQDQSLIALFDRQLPKLSDDRNLFIGSFSKLIESGSVGFVSAFLIDSTDLSPSFFKRFYHEDWRRLTKYPLDTQTQFSFDKRFSISTNPILDLLSIWNYQIKFHLIKESAFVPQVTLGVAHFLYLPMYDRGNGFNGIRPISLHGIGSFVTFSKSFSDNLKFFFGGRYIHEDYKISFSDEFVTALQAIDDFDENRKGSILRLRNFAADSGDFFTGLTFISEDSNWETSFVMGTDFDKVFYWIWSKSFSFLTFGFNFQPISVISFRPFLQLRFSF